MWPNNEYNVSTLYFKAFLHCNKAIVKQSVTFFVF